MSEFWAGDLSRRELLRRMGGLEQVAGVRLVTVGDGGERGTRLLEFRTGTGLSFDVLVDRAFDIGRCEIDGKSLAWHSGVGFKGPWYAEQLDLGWFRTWGGGLLTTCGIDHALFMAEDTARQHHYAPKATEKYGLHGRISNSPARIVGYGERWDGDVCTLWAEGETLQASAFGEHLVLRRRIEAVVGESRMRIHDVVENVGWDPTPHMYLYHVNAGFPCVDAGAEILVPTRSVTGREGQVDAAYRTLDAPIPDHYEQVFIHDAIAEADGRVPVAVVNRARGIGVYEVYDSRQLPVHFVWRMCGEGLYAVGMEPGTNRPAGRLDARERGELIILEPGESRTYDLELGALRGGAEIDAFAARVAALGGI
jgi:hypothetical protein